MNLPALLVASALSGLVASAQTFTPAQAEKLVKKAVSYAKQNGIEKLLIQTNQPNGVFHVGSGGELYLFIYDQQGVCKAIGYNSAALAGSNRIDLKDPDGKFIIKAFIALAKDKGKGWVDYKYPDPVTGKVMEKTSYVELSDGLIFGCGIYKR